MATSCFPRNPPAGTQAPLRQCPCSSMKCAPSRRLFSSKRQKPPSLRTILRFLRQPSQSRCVEISLKQYRHGEPPSFAVLMVWTPPAQRHQCAMAGSSIRTPQREGASVMEITTVGLDLAKNVLQIHGVMRLGSQCEASVEQEVAASRRHWVLRGAVALLRRHGSLRYCAALGPRSHETWSYG